MTARLISRDGDAPVMSKSRRTAPRRERVRTQDLTVELLRDWLDDACIDASLDEHGDLLARVDETRVRLRFSMQDGLILIACSISLGTAIDDEQLASTVNLMNRETTVVRVVACGLSSDDPYMSYEHDHWALDGVVSRRQVVKLVMHVKAKARDLHRDLYEALNA